MTDFLTRVKFINRESSLYQEHWRQDGLSDVLPRQKKMMEFLSDYFNPFDRRIFIIHGYSAKNQSMVGYLHQGQAQPILKTALKIASYLTLVLPLMAFVALLAFNGSVQYIDKPDEMKAAARVLFSCYHQHRVESKKASDLAHAHYVESISSHTRIGGEISLAQQPVWVNFKPIQGHDGSYVLCMKAMAPKNVEESAMIASARLDYNDIEQQATLSQVQVNTIHPYLYKNENEKRVNFTHFDAAPESMEQVLESLGKSLFLAAVRLLSSKLHFMHAATQVSAVVKGAATPSLFSSVLPPAYPTIRVIGDLASLLTHDGENRVVSDKYFTMQSDDMPAQIHAPAHLYEQIAFQEMLMATIPKTASTAISKPPMTLPY